MQLSEIQKRFKGRLLTHPDEDSRDTDLEAVMDVGKIDFDYRFSVYCDNYINGLSNVLAQIYPTVKMLVGDEFMQSLSRAYIKDHLPQSGNLNDYGGEFSDFIAACEQTKSVPYLPDLARLEWAKNVAYHAPDDQVVDLARLQMLSADQQEHLVFHLRTSCLLLHSDWPVLDILDFVQTQDEKGDAEMNLEARQEHVMIYRPKHHVQLISLEPSSFQFLEQIQNGLDLSQAVETILQLDPNFDLVTFLQTQYKLGTFSGFHVN